MPTVIALDVSLSMSRPVLLPDVTEEYQRKHLANHGINSFLDYLSSTYKLEFVSLIAFSYLWEQLSAFTRDYSLIRAALNKVEAFSKTCVETVLNGIKTVITDEWNNCSCQVILITDGSLGVGVGSLKKSLQSIDARQSTEDKFPLPYLFPCKLHIVCIGNPNDPDVRSALPYYQKLIDVGQQGGELFTLDGPITLKSVEDVFHRLAEKYYSPFCGTLSCGNFVCGVHLFPRPDTFVRQMDDGQETYSVSDKLEIIGFIDIKDIGSPPTVARHLVLPKTAKDKSATENKEGKSGKAEEEDESLDDGKIPSFTVLLHGSLKVESMVAITRVQDNWYGMIYSWADSKKKSNLMLALFDPGQISVPWIGQFDHLISCKEYLPEVIYSDDDKKSPFPVRPPDKRSYAQSCVVWIKPSGLQSDIQKVLRHARKLPDKLQQFYKTVENMADMIRNPSRVDQRAVIRFLTAEGCRPVDIHHIMQAVNNWATMFKEGHELTKSLPRPSQELNRTRRAALSFGFLELLEAMAAMLERECRLLPGTAHPDAALQLSHAANALRSEVARDVTKTIMALQTNFASGSSG